MILYLGSLESQNTLSLHAHSPDVTFQHNLFASCPLDDGSITQDYVVEKRRDWLLRQKRCGSDTSMEVPRVDPMIIYDIGPSYAEKPDALVS